MGSVQVARRYTASVQDAERCWYDATRWGEWIDGLDRVREVAPGWPEVGSSVTWESGPAGRGRVSERVVSYQPADGQTVEVSDVSITGRQTVGFRRAPGGVEVTLGLRYDLRRRSVFTPIVDRLFVRRAMTASLERTLTRFGGALERQPARGGA
jgi:hypothetical protein